MNIRAELQKRIDKKKVELDSLQTEISTLFVEVEKVESALSELQSLLKVIPKTEADGDAGPQVEIILRRGSDMALVREVLRRLHQPTYIDDILKAMDRDVTKKARASLAGQISFYVRKEQIFTKTAPNTFGLREWDYFNPEFKIVATADEALPLGDDDAATPNTGITEAAN
jgi:hypothetical protein